MLSKNKYEDEHEDKTLQLLNVLKSKDNTSLTMMDFTPGSSKMLNNMVDFTKNADVIEPELYKKYKKYGIEFDRSRYNSGALDVELSGAQSNWIKLGNALEQTIVNEVGLGTAIGFADLYDIVLGRVFADDEDYQNPVSVYLEKLQEQFKEHRPIYQNPEKTDWKHWSDFGWWMNNVPSIMSSLTLLIPGAGVGKGVSMIGKGLGKGLRKTVAFTRKGAKAARGAELAEEAAKFGKFERFINKPTVIAKANRFVENGTTALAMRLMENYQESRQVYNDMMDNILETLKYMTPEQKEEFIKRNDELLKTKNVDINNDRAIAQAISQESADRTFNIDLANLTFDVIKMYALGNPIKLPKKLRTTAKINKHQRESKIFAKYSNLGKEAATREAAKELASRSTSKKALDWISDRAKARWLITAELTEGIEEAVNYVAQQEGMNYGNLMLKPEEANPDNYDRWTSYLNNSELYESAFWGVLGGIVFEGGGAKIRRAYNATVNTISKNKNINEDTMEGGNKTSWKIEYETTENKTRNAEIDKRFTNLMTLDERRATIFEEGKSPFEDDAIEPGKPRELTNQLEKDAAWQRAVDEYLVNQTLLAMESGNYELFKEYLRDPEVKKAVEGIINTNKSNNTHIDVEDLIKRMDEVENIYTNNLITVNSFASMIGEVPLEYVSIIARNNTLAQIKADRLQKKIEAYEKSAESNGFRFKNSLQSVFGEPTLDYKTATKLITATQYLRELRAAKANILNDNRRKGSLQGQITLNEINNKIGIINNYVKSLQPSLQLGITDAKLFGVINSLFATELSLDETSDDYYDFSAAIATRNLDEINRITGNKFELTDDDIVKVFGEGNADGTFYKLTEEILNHFGVDKNKKDAMSKFEEAAPNLKDDYDTISALEISKILEQAKVADTYNSVNHQIGKLNNEMNEARRVAIEGARNILIENAKKYGRRKMYDYVFNDVDIADLDKNDKNKIDDALRILNLTNPINKELADAINWSIILGDYEKSVNDANKEKSSSGNQKRNSDDNKTKQGDNTKILKELNDGQNNDAESEMAAQSEDTNTEKNQKQHIAISANVDTGTSFTLTSSNDKNSVPFIEGQKVINGTTYDTYELDISSDSVSRQDKDNYVSNSDLFNGYDKNNKNKYRITKNPVLIKDDKGHIYVDEKGEIEYKKEEPKKELTTQKLNPATGEVDEEENTSPIEPTEEEAEKEQKALEDINKELDFRRKLFKNLNSIIKSAKANNISDAEITNMVNSAINNIKSEKEYNKNFDNIIEETVKILFSKNKLISIVEDIDNVKSSTIIERETGSYTQEFIDRVYELITDYAQTVGAKKNSNGKYYINLENFIRNLNAIYKGYYEGDAIYNKIRSFLKSDANQIVVITDDIDDPNILDNARKSVEDRLREQIGTLDKHRVGIEDYFEKDSNFGKIFDEIQVGEKLKLGKDEFDRIIVLYNNTPVGIIGKVKRTNDHRGFIQTNKGWITDTYDNVNESKLREHLGKLAFDKEVDDIIFSILYDKMSDNKREDLKLKAFDILYEKSKAFIDKERIQTDDDKIKAVEWICNLWRYKMTESTFNIDEENRGVYVERFLDDFFEKIHNSYKTIINLYEGNYSDVTAVVANINEGELIRIIDENKIDLTESRKSRDNYNKFVQSNKALKNPDSAEVGVVTENGLLTLSKNKHLNHAALGSKGTIHIVIPSKTGKPQFVIATSVRIDGSRTDKRSDAYKIIQESKDYLNQAIDNYLNNKTTENYDILVNVINQLMGGSNIINLFSGLYVSRPLNHLIQISTNKSIKYGDFIQINKNALTFSYRKNNDTIEERIEGNEDTFKTILNDLFNNNCFFNADFNLFQGNPDDSNSLIRYSHDGKSVNITINKKPYVYDNISQAFIKGGLLRVNIGMENGSNYRRIGKNQAANAILEVTFESKDTSPVENTKEETLVTNTKEKEITGEEILINEDANTAVDKLIDIALPTLKKNDKKLLKDLELLPKSIIFAEKLFDKDNNPAVAQVVTDTEETKVSRLWLDMFDGVGEYSKDKDFYRKQAIRKLIHERIHVRISKEVNNLIDTKNIKNYDEALKEYLNPIKDIYNQFVEYVNNLAEDKKENLVDYFFNNKTNELEKLEEFLVESITSKTLAETLNSIEAKYIDGELDVDKIKETLWDKIIKFIAKIFGYKSLNKKGESVTFKINDKNLLQKELYALAGAINSKGEVDNNNNENDNSNIDDDFLDDDIGINKPKNEMNSTVIEKTPVYGSIDSFINSINSEQKIEVAKLIADGELSMICK